MKNLLLSLLGFVFFSFVTLSPLPKGEVKDLNGNKHDFSEIIKNDDKPVIVSFWATWCVPCIRELDAIAENYEEWQDATGVKLIAVSIDDEKTARRIKPLVNGRDWPYEVYHDFNGDLQRALHINNMVPYLIVIYKGKIVYTKNSYTPGSEEKLFAFIKSLK